MSKLGQMHHEEVGQWGWAAWFHPTAEVSRSSSSFTGSIIVTETECNKSCKFGPFHLNSAKTKKLGHNDGSLNKGKQPQKKTKQNTLPDTLGAHDRCVQCSRALRDPLYSCCSAGTQMQPHQRGFVSLWPLTGNILTSSWLGICPITPSCSFTH